MGGMCDEAISGNTPEELIGAGMVHLKVAHPQMATDIEKAPKDDPAIVKWSEDLMKTWAETPDM